METNSEKYSSSDEARVSDAFQELFHYTSITALKGILQTNTLWATRATHLNDSSEMELIWPRITPLVVDFFKKKLGELVEKDPAAKRTIEGAGGVSQIAKSDGSKMVDILRSQMLGDSHNTSLAPLFIVSFTTHSGESASNDYHRQNGMLSQWRGYCANDGVAIVFDASGIENLLQAESGLFHYWPLSLSEVVYESKDLALETCFPNLLKALEGFVDQFVDVFLGKRVGTTSNKLMDLDQVFSMVGSTFARLKHQAFHEERECRIIAGATPESIEDQTSASGSIGSKSFKTVHNRPSDRGSVPYIRLFEGCNDNLPIDRVIVGPSRNQMANLETVRDLVRGKGIEAQPSKTPFVVSSPPPY